MTDGRKRVPVLYLDIDGTVRHGKDQLGRFVNSPDDVVVFPEAIQRMRRWKADGGRIIGVSNQGGIALGLIPKATVAQTMLRTHELAESLFDQVSWCPHHPTAQDPEMAHCWCRKPAPGLLIASTLDQAERHPDEAYPLHLALLVGDRNEDRECARLAKIAFMDAAEWRAQA